MSRPPRSLTHLAALLALLLLAFAVRVYALDAQSLWYDEAVTAQVAQQGLGELTRWTADDIQPPLYYALTAGWTRLTGSNEWALRFPSVACGLAMVALAYALGKRLFDQPAAWIAAFLAAIHPLWVYYSQEARMYTLLTALGMVAGYALLRVLSAHRSKTRRQRLTWWAVFAVTAVALLYTHYFAAFLLLAYGLVFILAVVVPAVGIDAGRAGRRRLLVEGAVIALFVFLAYLPWLPNVFRRFGIDASYWQGALKLEEAIRHIAISFTTGETMLEHEAIPLAWGIALLAGLCWLALAWTAFRSKPALRLATVYVCFTLLVPIVAILVLSFRTPKFNPRYLMLASPAFVLALAGGLALPFTRQAGSRHASRLARLASLGALLAVTGVFLLADRNGFADPAFTKDDWRGAVAYVRSHLAPDERVVLVSGHALPAWRYYAPDIDPLRLPELEILDVNAVLDLSQTAAALEAGLGESQGAWLVQWQDNVVDPTAAVPYLLDMAGDRQPADASFWGLGSPQHYRWPQGTSFQSFVPPPVDSSQRGQAVSANFGNQVELVGYSQPPCDRPDCPVYLFWRALQPLEADYKLATELRGGASDTGWSESADRRLAAYDFPTFRWPPGRIIVSQLPLGAVVGTPPGDYRLRLSVYDATGQPLDALDAAGAAQGRWVWLEPVAVDSVVVDGAGAGPATSQAIRAAQGVTLMDLRLDADRSLPGQRVLLEAWWKLDEPQPQDVALSATWLDSAGSSFVDSSCTIVPSSGWPTGVPVRTQTSWQTPPAASPGSWTVRFGLVAGDCADPLAYLGSTVDLPLEVLPSDRRFEPSAPVQYPVNTDLGGVIRVIGVTVDGRPGQAATVQPGATVPVTVTWKAIAPIDTSFTGFVHLLDSAGTIVAQDDSIPRQGAYPTTQWVEGEVVEDRFVLQLRSDLAPGDYRLEIGLYDADRTGLPRLKAPDGKDSLQVGPVIAG